MSALLHDQPIWIYYFPTIISDILHSRYVSRIKKLVTLTNKAQKYVLTIYALLKMLKCTKKLLLLDKAESEDQKAADMIIIQSTRKNFKYFSC